MSAGAADSVLAGNVFAGNVLSDSRLADNVIVGSIALLPLAAPRPSRLTLLGTGTVGSAFVRRYQRLHQQLALPPLTLIANSRIALECRIDEIAEALDVARSAPPPLEKGGTSPPPLKNGGASPPPLKKGDRGGFAFDLAPAQIPGPPFSKGGDEAGLLAGDIVVDASASEEVAARHARWLRRGVHVVTANKLGVGASLERALEIAQAQRQGHSRYGDGATVGAGLPLLRSIRELVRGGDCIRAVEGVLSGSLAWLFDRYDGMRPFSGFVREARAAGYTEPDPRIDLSGEDVRRKLLILARAAGLPLRAEDIRVQSLVPRVLADAAPDQVDALLPELDAGLRERFQQAWRDGARLRFVGRFFANDDGVVEADVGLRALPAAHALCGGSGTDNRVAIHSCRYDAQPLVIQGPGAGAEVTAAALLDDIVAIARQQSGPL
jgi:homoserine dehydrogenase